MSVTILKRNKALTVNPLKVSQPVGATLAFLGINKAMPLMHGSQGCTAFAKVMFVRHFREPIPLQTTAMDQISTVMGADDSIVEALTTIFSKNKPRLIGLMTTGLSETQGADIRRAVKMFRDTQPEFAACHVVPVDTPDYVGGFESGFSLAVKAVIETVVPQTQRAGMRQRQVNVLAGAHLTPGDVEALKELIEAFELRPVILPDIADSLDGHLTPNDFTPHTVGGTPLSDIELMGESAATLVFGAALNAAADVLAERTGVPDYRFDHLLGLDAVDSFVHTLSRIAQRPVPERVNRQRAQLQDALVDAHFMLGMRRVAIAAEPDQLLALSELAQGVGMEVVAAVAPSRGPALERLALAEVKIGDLEDLEQMARAGHAELLLGNSHCGQAAARLHIPLLRIGFPLYDLVGGYQRTAIGYRGTRALLFDLANLMLEHGHHEIEPYRSVYKVGD
ncbi:MAG: nitrogenase iron-molybdenum cofactor biosynthesis protein NifN [Pseudomonadota bacterium]